MRLTVRPWAVDIQATSHIGQAMDSPKNSAIASASSVDKGCFPRSLRLRESGEHARPAPLQTSASGRHFRFHACRNWSAIEAESIPD